MKSFVIVSIILVISFYGASSTQFKSGLYRHPHNPGMCTIDDDMILRPGEYKNHNDGECSTLKCYANGHVEVKSCLNQAIRDGCVEGDVLSPNAPYPDCCKRSIKCRKF